MFDDTTDDDDMPPHAYGDGGPREALERSQTVSVFMRSQAKHLVLSDRCGVGETGLTND